ncbi:zinc-dependent alcohol dehydrogenase [Haladaptatus pallidirubidus]|uniref:zinc-dependent alcohol dehydrogenase n=1 Tax=Haladaptatus pallidirubidus TaxID=1008152 RepID=UPI001D111685|nr:zinc-binding alcohol dehydrogenase [Haladaptatus pallidirubidus]
MPSTRTVYFTGPRELDVRVEGISEPGRNEVLVRAEVSAVSPGTELLVYRGDAPTELATDATIDALSGTLEFPLQYGYATAGKVVSTGENVSKGWVGESVFAFHPHASHFLASPADLVRIPEEYTPTEAVFLPTVETAVNFVLDGTPRIGEQAVIFGQGVVGLMTTGLLANYPLSDLVTVDRYPERRELAKAMGAECSLDATGNVREEIEAELSRAKTPAGADLTYELSGNPSALDDAISVTGYDGRVLVGSWYGEKRAELNLGGSFHRSRIDIESTQVSTLSPELRGRWDSDRRLAVAWRRLSNLDVTSLVTHRVSIGDAHEAYRLLDECPNEAVAVLLTYD